MGKSLIRIAVTGGAGQIAYSILFKIAHGDLLGYDQPIALHILEIEPAINFLKGVQMELEDCAFPLLKEIIIGSNPKEVFRNIHYAFLIGAKPRGPGMERADLLKDNGNIFIEQGIALNDVANSNVKVLVVGNPCNTNCLIAMNHAPRIPKTHFHAMTRLDQNRATALLAHQAKVDINDVKNVIIWGNHSSTQVPDFVNATILQQPVTQKITDTQWLENQFFETIQKRGAAVIAARGKSSAASAANAAIDAMRSLLMPTPPGEWFSSAVSSDGNPYGIQENLVFSFPCRSNGDGNYEIVKDLKWTEFLKYKIKLSEKELLEEREMIKEKLSPKS